MEKCGKKGAPTNKITSTPLALGFNASKNPKE